MRRFLHIIITAAVAAVFISCSGKKGMVNDVFSEYDGKYIIVVTKEDFTLAVYERGPKVVASYRIGYGSNPDRDSKMHEGDCRTPEGIYAVNKILSMDADRGSAGYRELKGMNRMFFRASHGHSKFGKPGCDLGDNVYGPRFYGINYPVEKDRQLYRKRVEKGIIAAEGGKLPGIGSGIGIHGNSDIPSIGNLCSMGCIRMYNEDAIEIEQYIRIGTPVIILGY